MKTATIDRTEERFNEADWDVLKRFTADGDSSLAVHHVAEHRSRIEQYVADLICDPVLSEHHITTLASSHMTELTASPANSGGFTQEQMDNVITGGVQQLSDRQILFLLSTIPWIAILRRRLMRPEASEQLSGFWKKRFREIRRRQLEHALEIDEARGVNAVIARRDLELGIALQVARLSDRERWRTASRLREKIAVHEGLALEKKGIASEEWVIADREFHLEIFQALSLRCLEDAFIDIHRRVHDSVLKYREARDRIETQKKFIKEHKWIASAIESGSELDIIAGYNHHIFSLAKELRTRTTKLASKNFIAYQAVEQRENIGVAEHIRSLEENDQLTVLIGQNDAAARELDSPLYFAAHVALALFRGASFAFAVDNQSRYRGEHLAAFRVLHAAVKSELGKKHCSLAEQSLEFFSCDMSQATASLNFSPENWPVGFKRSENGQGLLTFWDGRSLVEKPTDWEIHQVLNHPSIVAEIASSDRC